MVSIEHRIGCDLGTVATETYSLLYKIGSSKSQTVESVNIDQLEGKRLDLRVKV